MAEGFAYGEQAPTPSRSQPAYGEGRLSYEPPPKVEKHLGRRSHSALAVAIFGPAVAAYGLAAYGLYLAMTAIF
jgi:hypothetical protein